MTQAMASLTKLGSGDAGQAGSSAEEGAAEAAPGGGTPGGEASQGSPAAGPQLSEGPGADCDALPAINQEPPQPPAEASTAGCEGGAAGLEPQALAAGGQSGLPRLAGIWQWACLPHRAPLGWIPCAGPPRFLRAPAAASSCRRAGRAAPAPGVGRPPHRRGKPGLGCLPGGHACACCARPAAEASPSPAPLPPDNPPDSPFYKHNLPRLALQLIQRVGDAARPAREEAAKLQQEVQALRVSLAAFVSRQRRSLPGLSNVPLSAALCPKAPSLATARLPAAGGPCALSCCAPPPPQPPRARRAPRLPAGRQGGHAMPAAGAGALHAAHQGEQLLGGSAAQVGSRAASSEGMGEEWGVGEEETACCAPEHVCISQDPPAYPSLLLRLLPPQGGREAGGGGGGRAQGCHAQGGGAAPCH